MKEEDKDEDEDEPKTKTTPLICLPPAGVATIAQEPPDRLHVCVKNYFQHPACTYPCNGSLQESGAAGDGGGPRARGAGGGASCGGAAGGAGPCGVVGGRVDGSAEFGGMGGGGRTAATSFSQVSGSGQEGLKPVFSTWPRRSPLL